jgi:hypothetical protein
VQPEKKPPKNGKFFQHPSDASILTAVLIQDIGGGGEDFVWEIIYLPRFLTSKYISIYLFMVCSNLNKTKGNDSLSGEESSTRVLPDMSLFNIIITPTLREKIIATQKNDEDMCHIKRRMEEGDSKVACFRENAERAL